MNNIHIHLEQAFYGDIGKSHGCLISTYNDTSLNSLLTAFTDRPGSIPAGIVMTPYLSGIVFDGKYIFTKTFPDFEAVRGGMVFTHVLIANISDLSNIKDLNDILVNFVNEVSKQTKLETITFIPSVPKKKEIDECFPIYIQNTLENILTANLPVLFSGKLLSFEKTLCTIWMGLPTGLKKGFSFTSGFSASAIDTSKTIIYFQENLKPLLKNLTYVDDAASEKVPIESEIERFILFKNSKNSFDQFVTELNIQLNDWSILSPVVIAFQLYQKEDLYLEQDEIRLLARNIAKVSKNPSSGTLIKDKIIQKLAKSVSTEEFSNIKSLKNLILDGFPKGEKIISGAIITYIEKTFNSKSNLQIEIIAELLSLSNDKKTDWWSKTVVNGFATVFGNLTPTSINNVWKILLASDSSIDDILSFIPADGDAEKILIQSLPNSIPNVVAKKISSSIRYKNWYSLHANLLLHYLSAEEATKKQLDFERRTQSASFEGTGILLDKLNDTQLLAVIMDKPDDLLINEYASRSVNRPELLKLLDVLNPVWLKIWSESLNITGDLTHGTENLSTNIEIVIKLICKGISIPDKILLLIAGSEFSDLSGQQNRENVWKNLPQPHMQKFLQATANGCMSKVLNGELLTINIETDIKSILSSDEFVTKFLSDNRLNINAVLIAFSSIEGLKDKFLSDYITYLNIQLSEFQSSKLGNLVLEKRFPLSARQIFEKSKDNHSYRIALDTCTSLIDFTFYEKLIYSGLLGEKITPVAVYLEIQKKAITMYPKGPEDNDIWKRAGGDISKFMDQRSREENWKHGIHLLKNGGGGKDITTFSLLKIMIEDHPQNIELKELKKYF